jgi:alpha-tubulin suppressor-like RCC1 family protein
MAAGLLAAAPPASGSPLDEPSWGQLWAFGSNGAAQLGNETNVETQEPNLPTPVTLPAEAGRAISAAAGGEHTLVITESGQAYAFGWNYHGQLGNSTYIEGQGSHGWNPVPALIVLPGQEGQVVQVAGGSDFSLALTESGQLYAFGENSFGELGNETNINQITGKANPTPTLVTLPGQNGPVVEVAAGLLHTLALTESGQLYSFGANNDGQLGRETVHKPGEWANPTPTLVTLPGQDGPVMQIAAGRTSSFAVTESGQLYAFGENRYGQLGFAENSGPGPDPSENAHPTPTLVTLPGGASVAEVAAGSFHTLALTDGGQLYAFGKNTFGELGNSTNNETQEANPAPTAVSLPAGAGQITELAAGYEDSFVLTEAGRLYSFGWNSFAQLGRAVNNKSLDPNPAPTLVSAPAGAAFEAVGTGATASHALVVIGLVMKTVSLPSGQEGLAYDAQLEVEGGESPNAWSAKGLPAGLSVDEESGAISGIPSEVTCDQEQCRYSPTFTVTDNRGVEISRTLSLAVTPEPPPEPEPESPPGDDPGGNGSPPGDPPAPVEESGLAHAALRIRRVHPLAPTKLEVGGTIARAATGDVSLRAVVRFQGRRVVVRRSARITAGHWRVRLPLLGLRRLPGGIRLTAHFGGSPGVAGGDARRLVKLRR